MPTLTRLSADHKAYVIRVLTSRWGCGQAIVESEVEDYLAQKDGSLCFVLMDGETPIGMGVFSKKNDVGVEKSPWLFGLWVEPEHRGNGYGRLLTIARVEHARNLGHTKVYLDTDNAQKYHERFGWKHVGTGSYLGEKTEIMELDIAKAGKFEYPNQS